MQKNIMKIGNDRPWRVAIGIGYFECHYWGLGITCQKYHGLQNSIPWGGSNDSKTGLFRSYTLWILPIYFNVRYFKA